MAAADVIDAYLQRPPGRMPPPRPRRVGAHGLGRGARRAARHRAVDRRRARARQGARARGGRRARPVDAALVEPPDAPGALRLHALARDLGARGPARGRGRRARRSTACSGWWWRPLRRPAAARGTPGILAGGPHAGRQRRVLARLGGAPGLLERAASTRRTLRPRGEALEARAARPASAERHMATEPDARGKRGTPRAAEPGGPAEPTCAVAASRRAPIRSGT